LLYMGVKHVFLNYGKKIFWGWLKTKFWGKYLDKRDMK